MNIKKWWSGLTGTESAWKFHIDHPSAEHGCPHDTTGWIVQGWVLIEPSLYAQLQPNQTPYLSLTLNDNLVRYVPLDKARPDVLNKMLSAEQQVTYQAQVHCGFRLSMPLSGGRLPLRLHLGEEQHLLTEIHLPSASAKPNEEDKPLLKVLQGKDDWLFLDNDTNFSVDQHRGYLGLSQSCVKQWQRYIEAWQTQFQSYGANAVFLVAPTKESVLTDYYPYAAAKQNLLSTIFDLMPEDMYLYPVSQLQALGDAAYYKTDTHWTQQGACLTTRLVAERLGLTPERIEPVFAQDSYQVKRHSGDLGKKLDPHAVQPEAFLVGFTYRNCVVFDNGLPNFGRVLLIHCEEALEDATCLIFGSSSSYSMFSYLCRIFQRVVFVHSAGQIDTKLLQAVQPDYVIAQTNARFMVRPPQSAYNVLAQINEKNLSLTPQQKENIVVINQPEKQALIQQLGLEKYLPVL